MTNEELIQAYQGGDDTALGQLVENNTRLIKYFCNQYEAVGKLASLTFDDLEQESWIGFLKAVEDYAARPLNAEATFSTYASNGIKWRMLRAIESGIPKLYRDDNDSRVQIDSLHKELTNDEDATLLVDMMVCKRAAEAFDQMDETLDTQILRRDLIQLLQEVFHKPSDKRTLNFMFLHYGLSGMKPMSVRDLTAIFNTSTTALHSRRVKALNQIRTSGAGRSFMVKYRTYFLEGKATTISSYSPERAIMQRESYEQTERKLHKIEGS